MINAVIIDDEKKAALYLNNIIADLDIGIEVLEIFNDPQLCLDYIQSNDIDLLFLDIDMPIMSGLDLLKEVKDPNFEIIFVTGYDEYAIEAFQFCAIGYILKPVDEEDLLHAIKNAKKRIKADNSIKKNTTLLDNLHQEEAQKRKIGVQTINGLEFIFLKDIIRCEALKKVTKIIFNDRDYLISSYNIGHFNSLLADYNFFQVHKSHLINLDKIEKYLKSGEIQMADKSIVPLARRRKSEFLKWITK